MNRITKSIAAAVFFACITHTPANTPKMSFEKATELAINDPVFLEQYLMIGKSPCDVDLLFVLLKKDWYIICQGCRDFEHMAKDYLPPELMQKLKSPGPWLFQDLTYQAGICP